MTDDEECSVSYGRRVDDSTIAIDFRGEDVLFKLPADNDGIHYGERDLFIDNEIYYLLDNLESGDVFYDLGAHVGTYTVTIATLRPNVTVVSFEPHDAARRRLEKSLSANDADAIVRPYAMGENNDTGYWRATGGNGMASVKREAKRTNRVEVREVPLRTLDHVVYEEGLPFPNVMKLDIEGHEIGLLKNSQQVLSNKELREINIEVHPWNMERMGCDPTGIWEPLDENGFETHCLENYRESIPEGPFLISAWREKDVSPVYKFMAYATRDINKTP